MTVHYLTRYGKRNKCRLCGAIVDYRVTQHDFDAGCDMGRVDCECGLTEWRPIKQGRK